MMQSVEELTVAQRLGQLLDRGLLPAGGPAEAGERLIERLERPARVALLGLPGSGKSAILNLLTGTVVVPETLRLPTIIVQHGGEERMLCTLTDGRTEIVPGSDLNNVLALNPALVTLEMDLPALKVISLLEVSAGPMEAEQRRAAVWASKRADILIWCTTSYLPKEQQVWDGMPDVVKDNGFLFLTKTDLLGSRDAAAGMLERVETRAGEEFRQVLSISAKQARAATPAGGPVDREMFRDSGAAAVITTIKSRVQAARRADTDMAELLLARHVEAGGIVARRFAEPASTTATPVPAPQWTPPPEAPPEAHRQAPPEVPPEAEPVAAAAVHPVAEPDIVALFASDTAPPPEPAGPAEPEPAQDHAPEPEAEPEPRVDPEPQSSDGRKRFSDRIKQMPLPDEPPGAAQIPLRSTWKSKAETAATARPKPLSPEPEDLQYPAPEAVRRPVPRPAASDARRTDRAGAAPAGAGPDADAESAAVSAMLAAVAAPAPDIAPVVGPDVGPDAAPAKADVPREQETVPEDALADDPTEDAQPEVDLTDADLPEEDLTDLPRWTERLRPPETGAPPERSARTQLFGARKPTTAAPPALANGRPAERGPRPGEPVTRVRAPAPRPPEAPKPVAPAPEDLATPRIGALRDRRPEGAPDGAALQRTERRDRPRIAARAIAASAPGPVAPLEVSAEEQDVLASAIGQIVARSAELVAMVDPDEKIPVDMILEHSRQTIEQVIVLLGVARSAGLRRINGDLGEIQDIIMLMQLEKGHAPADDALTLLLQIRRDLETLRAA